MTDANSRFRAGEVAAELRAINWTSGPPQPRPRISYNVTKEICYV